MFYTGNVDILEYTSGSVFRGACNNRKPSMGVYQQANGNLYIGDYSSDGKFGGFGMYSFASGGMYVGYFRDDMYHGMGIQFRRDGDIVFAEFENGRIVGDCVIYSNGGYNWYREKGDKLVQIDNPSEIPDCFGWGLKSFKVIDCSNGDSYAGFVDEDGKFSSWGIYRFKDSATYIGEFSDHDFNGVGCKILSDNIMFVGEFISDKFDEGTCFFPKENYVKLLSKSREECAVVFLDGSMYEGGCDSETGRYHGFGTYSWPTGACYRGFWKDGIRFGRGTNTYDDGKTEEGVWLDGDMIKPGTETYKQLCRYSDGPSFWEKALKALPAVIIGVAAVALIAKLGGNASDIMRKATAGMSTRVPGMSSAASHAINFTGNAASRSFKNGCIRTSLSPMQSHLAKSLSPVFRGNTPKVLKIAGGGLQTLKVQIGKPRGTITEVLYKGVWHSISSDHKVYLDGHWWKL